MRLLLATQDSPLICRFDHIASVNLTGELTAALPNSGESAGDLGALLALRNALLDASVLLLDGLAAGQPVERLN